MEDYYQKLWNFVGGAYRRHPTERALSALLHGIYDPESPAVEWMIYKPGAVSAFTEMMKDHLPLQRARRLLC